MKKGFTIIELLVVVAIVSIIAIVVVLTLNPPDLFRQARDTSRISDMGTLNKAISLYYQDAMSSPSTMFMGTSSIIYISVPDPTAGVGGNQCQGLGLPAAPTGYTYQCAASSTYMKTNGTGWIPINFGSYVAGSVISKLPVDPTNTTSTNFYYTYVTDGIGGFKVAAFLESLKDAPQMAKDGGNDPALYEKGSNLALASGRGLIGYWPMDEGTGSTAIDYSGSNGTGTWSGSQTGSSGYYSAGKLGPWAGTFDGSTDYVLNNQTVNIPVVTVSAWIYASSYPGAKARIVGFTSGNNGVNYDKEILIDPNGKIYFYVFTNTSLTTSAPTNPIPINQWVYVVGTANGTTAIAYVNGAQVGSVAAGNTFASYTSPDILIGGYEASDGYFKGLIDDVRVYNRALSAAEIQETYNAEK